MRFRLQEVAVLIKPALTSITWISENLEDFVQALDDVSELRYFKLSLVSIFIVLYRKSTKSRHSIGLWKISRRYALLEKWKI